MDMSLALALFRCPILPCPWIIALVAGGIGFAAGYYFGKNAGKSQR